MAFELLNQRETTPTRVHAMLRLLARRPGLTREQIDDLVRPGVLPVGGRNEANEVLRNTVQLGLASTGEGESSGYQLAVAQEHIEDLDAYRNTISRIALGVTDSSADHYAFNLFTAWYAVIDDEVLRRTVTDLVIDFNERVFPTAEISQMNDERLTSWRAWAAFLGFGWMVPRGAGRTMVPDCTGRVSGLVERRLAGEDGLIPFRAMWEHIAAACPELDGGVLFERARQTGRGGHDRGQTVSLMLSTALRSMHDGGRCRLHRLADATDTWTLFPASGQVFQAVTHISRGTGDAGVE